MPTYASAAWMATQPVKAKKAKAPEAIPVDMDEDMEPHGGVSQSPERNELIKKLADLDALIGKLQPMSEDLDVQALVDEKKLEKQTVQASLKSRRPIRTQMKIAAEMLDKARRKHTRILEEEQGLQAMIQTKRQEMQQVAEEIAGHLAEVSALECKLRDEGAEGIQDAEDKILVTTVAGGVPSTQAVPSQQWLAFQRWCQDQVLMEDTAGQTASPTTPVEVLGTRTPNGKEGQQHQEEGEATTASYGPAMGPFRASVRMDLYGADASQEAVPRVPHAGQEQ